MEKQAIRRPLEPPDPTSLVNQGVLAFGDALRRYHRHGLVGVEYLTRALHAHRPVILVGNHCMDIADPLMLRTAIYRATGRLIRFIGHELASFRLPIVRSLMGDAGVIPSRQAELAAEVLREDGILALYPGAGAEAALRSYRREPYRLKWYGRFGFVDLVLRERATLLFVAGIGIDEMYFQTDIRVPDSLFGLVDGTYLELYRGMRLQLGAAGLHVVPGLFPLPVKVTHTISAPLHIDRSIDPDDRKAVESTQIRIWAECQELLDRAVAARGGDLLDTACRRGAHLLQAIGV